MVQNFIYTLNSFQLTHTQNIQVYISFYSGKFDPCIKIGPKML